MNTDEYCICTLAMKNEKACIKKITKFLYLNKILSNSKLYFRLLYCHLPNSLLYLYRNICIT